MTALDARARRPLRVVVDCNDIEFLAILNYAKAIGLTPQVGAADTETARIFLNDFLAQHGIGTKQQRQTTRAAARRSNGKGRVKVIKGKVKRHNPKRWPPNLMVRVADTRLAGLTPRQTEILTAIEDTFGRKPFRKGNIKQAMIARMGTRFSTGHLTVLLDKGAITEAEKKS